MKVHAYLISHLKRKMPALWGKQTKQQELIANLLNEYKEVKRGYKLPAGDFPDLERFRESLKEHDFDSFAKLDERLIFRVEEALAADIPKLMAMISPPKPKGEAPPVLDNPFQEDNPFGNDDGEHQDDSVITPQQKVQYDKIFASLNPQGGKLTGAQVKQTLMDTGVSTAVLRKLWALADVDKDGRLDADEFAVAMRLTEIAKKEMDGNLPFDMLPPSLVPPSKANLILQQQQQHPGGLPQK